MSYITVYKSYKSLGDITKTEASSAREAMISKVGVTMHNFLFPGLAFTDSMVKLIFWNNKERYYLKILEGKEDKQCALVVEHGRRGRCKY